LNLLLQVQEQGLLLVREQSLVQYLQESLLFVVVW
jgi:hypothetical protein